MTKNEKLDRAIYYLKVYGKKQRVVNESIAELESLKDKPKKVVVKVYSLGVINCYNNCLKHFPEHLHPKNPDNWKDVIDKLNRIDGIEFQTIIGITAWARADDFWAINFMSLVKLRHKSKQGIMWIVEFYEKMKYEKNKTLSTKGASIEELRDTLTKHFD